MAKKASYAALKYTFIIKRADNPWNDVFDFENDLKDFFSAHQFDLEPLQTVEGSGGDRMLLITKIDEMNLLNNKQHMGGHNMPQHFNTGKSQKSYNTTKQLTNSLGHGKKA